MNDDKKPFGEIVKEMKQWCIDNDEYAFSALCRHARKNEREWFRVLMSNSGTKVMSQWCRVQHWHK